MPQHSSSIKGQGICCWKYARLNARMSFSVSEDGSCSRASFGKIPERLIFRVAAAKLFWIRILISLGNDATSSASIMASGGESGTSCRQQAPHPLLQEIRWPSLAVMRAPMSATVLLRSNAMAARSTRRIVASGNSISASIRPSGRSRWMGSLRVCGCEVLMAVSFGAFFKPLCVLHRHGGWLQEAFLKGLEKVRRRFSTFFEL